MKREHRALLRCSRTDLNRQNDEEFGYIVPAVGCWLFPREGAPERDVQTAFLQVRVRERNEERIFEGFMLYGTQSTGLPLKHDLHPRVPFISILVPDIFPGMIFSTEEKMTTFNTHNPPGNRKGFFLRQLLNEAARRWGASYHVTSVTTHATIDTFEPRRKKPVWTRTAFAFLHYGEALPIIINQDDFLGV